MQHTGASLKTNETPLGILDLEFASSVSKATIVINAWQKTGNPDNIQAAKLNTELDFIFLIFYSIFLNIACRSVAMLYTGTVRTLGLIAAFGAIAAGLMDIMENIGMLLTLHGHIYPAVTLLTFTFSVIKWGLALLALMYFVVGGGASLLNSIFSSKKSAEGPK